MSIVKSTVSIFSIIGADIAITELIIDIFVATTDHLLVVAHIIIRLHASYHSQIVSIRAVSNIVGIVIFDCHYILLDNIAFLHWIGLLSVSSDAS